MVRIQHVETSFPHREAGRAAGSDDGRSSADEPYPMPSGPSPFTVDALNITKETCGNEVYSRALLKVHDSIREGESMADPLRATKVCDALVVNMIDVGEETGDLDKMLMKIADNYDEEVDVLISSLVSLLEPIMVVTLGGIVGTIVVALFLPLVKLIQSVSGGAEGDK